MIQSFIALGSGGLFGAGLGNSKQKLFYLPASHTDFIFSIIGEELGFLGAGAVVILFAVLVWKGATKAAAVASILSGTIVTLVWNEADFIKNSLPSGISDLDAVLPAITISVLCLVVVSRLTRNKANADSAAKTH